ncbi:preprotein translocase subunit SecE [bacterium]|nr:preprotein translocase subunit SecE [bacterium]
MISNGNVSGQKNPSFMDGIVSYFKGVRSEWGKITWPERRQVVSETFCVIVIVFIFTVSVYLMDIIFKGLLGLIKP